jgi:hypothetical protein
MKNKTNVTIAAANVSNHSFECNIAATPVSRTPAVIRLNPTLSPKRGVSRSGNARPIQREHNQCPSDAGITSRCYTIHRGHFLASILIPGTCHSDQVGIVTCISSEPVDNA